MFLWYIFLNKIKIKTISENNLFFSKNSLFFIVIFFFFNFIGIPPAPSFFIKLNLLINLLGKVSFFFFIYLVFFSIFIFYFYSNLITLINYTNKSPKEFYQFFFFYIIAIIYVSLIFQFRLIYLRKPIVEVRIVYREHMVDISVSEIKSPSFFYFLFLYQILKEFRLIRV